MRRQGSCQPHHHAQSQFSKTPRMGAARQHWISTNGWVWGRRWANSKGECECVTILLVAIGRGC